MPKNRKSGTRKESFVTAKLYNKVTFIFPIDLLFENVNI